MSIDGQLVYVVPTKGWPNKDVVGEYYHQDAILALLPRLPGNGDPVEAQLDVALVPEKDNPHDRRAISVRSGDKVLGYLPKDMAADYALPVQRVVASGATVRTTASVYAYLSTWKNEPEISVRVALPDPEAFAPLNQHYPTDTSVLPFGRSYQVTKEDDHFDHLFEYVPRSGSGMVLLTMHRKESVLKNGTTRELVELRLDGERVGELTYATSQHYLPLVRHAADKERTLGVWSRLTGSGVAAELTIHGLKSSEVTDEWLTEMPIIPRLVPEAHAYDVPPAYRGDAKPEKPSTGGRRAPASTSVHAFTVDLVAPDVAHDQQAGNTSQGSAGGKATIHVGKSSIELTDELRKNSPNTHRAGGIGAIIALSIVGLFLGLIPGIGPLLFLAAIGAGILMNRQLRLIARAIEIEASGHLAGPTLREMKKQT